MMHTTAKRITALCSMVVMLVLGASIAALPVHAAQHGIYTAAAVPSYRNPSTGEIEDSGGEDSAVLGQSMTESVTYGRALVEVDQDGSTYATIRLQMMDNIESVSFQVDGYGVSATTIQENYGSNTADFRIPVNSEYSVIRCNISVTAMGREVVFFITLSGLQDGSGDFITSIELAQPDPEPEPEPEPAKPEPTAAPNETKAAETEPVQTDPTETQAAETRPESKPAVDETKATAPAGLQEFDASGNQVTEGAEAPQEDEGGISVIGWVLIAVIAAGGIGFGVWYFAFFKKKK